MRFIGKQFSQLDEKNRLHIPSKYHEQLGKKYYLVYGAGGCLAVMTQTAFDEYCDPFETIPSSDIEAQNYARCLYANVEEIEEDNQGRFVVPAHAKIYAGIDRKVVFVGVGKRLEIWSEERFNAKQIDTQESVDKSVTSLSRYGF